MYKFLTWLVFQINARANTRYLNRMIKQADLLHSTNRKRYHVIPLEKGAGRKLVIVDNTFIKEYNKKAKKKINIHDLLELAYYSTK